MSTDALRLADALEEKDYPPRRAAANELRRLHEENERLKAASTAQRQWVGLTREDFIDLCEEASNFGTGGLIRHIEAKLREKNT